MASKKIIRQNIKTLFSRTSATYFTTKRLLKDTEYLAPKALEEMQFAQFKRILIYAYKNVDYYRQLFKDLKLTPESFNAIEDIRKIPCLTKDVLRKENKRFITDRASKKLLLKVYTGGTTGTPMPLFRYPNDFSRERAFEDYILTIQGADPESKRVHIRGEVNDSQGVYHAYSKINRTLYLSSHNLSDQNLKKYVDLINEFRPSLLYSLPSIATIIADYIKRNKLHIVDTIKHALTPSENIYPFQKEAIESVFGCKIILQYGHSEHCVIASPCDKNDFYHVLPQYGYVELIDENGGRVEENGRVGEIVATSFTNIGFPLIRYKTGDYAEYSNETCSCRRHYQLWKRVIGRGQAVALTKAHGKISIGPDLLCTIYNDEYAKIKQFKIEQNNIGKLNIYIQPYENEGFSDLENFFFNVFEKNYPRCFDLSVQEKDEAFFNQTDKNLYFIQNIK